MHSQPVVQPVKGRGHIRTPSDIEAMRPAELRYAPTVGACLSWSSSCAAVAALNRAQEMRPQRVLALHSRSAASCVKPKKKKLLMLDLCLTVHARTVMILNRPAAACATLKQVPVQAQQQDSELEKQCCCVAPSPSVLHPLALCLALAGIWNFHCPCNKRLQEGKVCRLEGVSPVRCSPCTVMGIPQVGL